MGSPIETVPLIDYLFHKTICWLWPTPDLLRPAPVCRGKVGVGSGLGGVKVKFVCLRVFTSETSKKIHSWPMINLCRKSGKLYDSFLWPYYDTALAW